MSRGYRTFRRFRNQQVEEDHSSFWMSYSDLMSALLLMFALFLMVSILNNQLAIEEKDRMIEEMIGVKTRIIEELVSAFEDSDLEMEVDQQTGAIRFSGGVFFETNSSAISETGREYLEKFIPKYIDILLSPQFRENIAQIIVEGHTDTAGGYLYNLQLSQNRALSVVQEIFKDDFPKFDYQEELKTVITANGRSFSVPIVDEKGKIVADQSRRVEFKFRLKDEELIEQIQELVTQNER
ncbi:membrane protein [Caldalkalibacillus thermarum]|uniref:OmpA family protein n=1 Tax=Caldalkalibacillus thermarum TaxID=296745 RepID=UPI0019C44FBD|nr:OmpA family protein [Caldalkalibacillus thermarum]GGK31621.1 membrane protein [Caldalkalibacillus thermarum]